MKKPFDYILLRRNAHEVSNLSIGRDVYAEPDGRLIQELYYRNKAGKPMLKVPEGFHVEGSADPHLQALDQHWKKLKQEISDIASQAAAYYVIKKGDDAPSAREEFAKDTLIVLSGHLLNQDLDDELPRGRVDADEYPVTHDSNRLDAMRQTARRSQIKLDRFEKMIDALGTRTYDAADMLDSVLGVSEDDDLEFAGMLQDDDGHGMGQDDEQAYGNEDEPLFDEDYDPDEERDERIGDLMEDYGDYVVDFTNLANKIWMDAAERIAQGKNPQADPREIRELKELANDTREAYESFKTASQELTANGHELRAIYDMLEDPEKGTLARMQKIIGMASRPALLETEIKKALYKGHGK